MSSSANSNAGRPWKKFRCWYNYSLASYRVLSPIFHELCSCVLQAKLLSLCLDSAHILRSIRILINLWAAVEWCPFRLLLEQSHSDNKLSTISFHPHPLPSPARGPSVQRHTHIIIRRSKSMIDTCWEDNQIILKSLAHLPIFRVLLSYSTPHTQPARSP